MKYKVITRRLVGYMRHSHRFMQFTVSHMLRTLHNARLTLASLLHDNDCYSTDSLLYISVGLACVVDKMWILSAGQVGYICKLPLPHPHIRILLEARISD